jgi:hypothetical protein
MNKKISQINILFLRFAWIFIIIGVSLLYFYSVISCKIWRAHATCELDKGQ